MNVSNQLLSDFVSAKNYAKFLSHLGRRETLAESINRNMNMHLDRFPKLSKDIIKAYQQVHDYKVLPSMRAMQFSGEAILKNNARQYNCSYTPINDVRVFGEILFLLLSGVGVGFSVQKHHIKQLPKVQKPREEGFFFAQDSIIGWAQCIDVLMDAYFYGRVRPQFDFGNIRSKGSYLVTTGAKAPGPAPLKYMLELVESKLKNAISRKLTSLELHDIVCIISDSVLSGGIRRSATISLFDRNDTEMLTCKHGEWWNNAPYRARANNSAVLPRSEVTKEEFDYVFQMCKESNAGEPGFSWTDNTDWGFNPSLRAGTKVWTKEYGIIPIEKLENKEFTVKNLYGNLSKAKCWMSSPNAELIEITLEGGFKYQATPQHEWPVLNKDGTYTKVKTQNLEKGMSFPRLGFQHNISNGTLGSFKDGKIVGYFYGDGWITDRKDNNKRQFGVCIPKNKPNKMNYLSLFEELFNGKGAYHKSGTIEFNSTSEKVYKYFTQFGVDKKEKGLPTKIWSECSNDFINGFIEGLLDADGCKGSKDNNRVSWTTSHKQFALEFQELLGFKGIYMNLTKLEFTEYKNSIKTYQKAGTRYTLRRKWKVAISGKPTKIISINKLDIKEPVWDIGVQDETHCFQLAGTITGNCHEISLNPSQFCNLTTINQTGISSEKDFMNRVYAASLIGTLQASYTDFPYLRPIWQETTEKEALLGVSFTGIADGNSFVTSELLHKGANLVLEVNEKYAKKLGINLAARTTTVKPEGSSSCVLGSSSGIHARHAQYYLRRVRMNKDDVMAPYLKSVIPELVEDDTFSSTGLVITIPQESPKGAIIRADESSEKLFNRVLDYNKNWVKPGYRSGDNNHNVSATISVKEDEWDSLREQMWNNRHSYSGVSLLPYDNSTYVQAPFEECSKEQYEKLAKLMKQVDFKQIKEEQDNTNRVETVACAGGQCEII